MGYNVDAQGALKLKASATIQKIEALERAAEQWEDLTVKRQPNGRLFVKLNHRTPYYPDVKARFYLIERVASGNIKGHGEDHAHVTIKFPDTDIDIKEPRMQEEFSKLPKELTNLLLPSS